MNLDKNVEIKPEKKKQTNKKTANINQKLEIQLVDFLVSLRNIALAVIVCRVKSSVLTSH